MGKLFSVISLLEATQNSVNIESAKIKLNSDWGDFQLLEGKVI